VTLGPAILNLPVVACGQFQPAKRQFAINASLRGETRRENLMDTIRNRAKEKFPMVLLTLLSIVQALALEFLWDHVRHRAEIFEISVIAFLGWLQIGASLIVIILIWLMYAGMLMRFRWTPTVTDSIWPFLVGLIQFLMIEIMGAEKLALWVIVLALMPIRQIVNFLSDTCQRHSETSCRRLLPS
jgi:hypothetical protein